MPARNPVARFFESIEQDALTGCWLWQGSTVTDAMRGYEAGQFWDGKRLVRAHRWSYAYHVAPIPPKYQVYHRCAVGLCVNPQHLELGVPNRRCALATHCPSGHPYQPPNLYVRPSDGARLCRACVTDSSKRSLARKPPYWVRRYRRPDVSTAEIIIRYAMGEGLRAIALALSTSKTTVRARLRSVAAPVPKGAAQ